MSTFLTGSVVGEERLVNEYFKVIGVGEDMGWGKG